MAERRDFHAGRHAGVLVPLFSIPSRRAGALARSRTCRALARWLRRPGSTCVQLLPVNEMAEGQNSPYSALSAMAIDPIFIALGEVPDFGRLGGEARSRPATPAARQVRARGAAVDYRTVRALKRFALRAAFEHFHDRRLAARHGPRRAFSASSERSAGGSTTTPCSARCTRARRPLWRDWERRAARPRRRRARRARAAARRRDPLHQYLQWLADSSGSARARAAPVGIFGDFPFMVSGDSADVWARQHEFRLDASVGAPPDAFSETGQDWGLPVYRWDVHRGRRLRVAAARARRSAELFDGYRVDHSSASTARTCARRPAGRLHRRPTTRADRPGRAVLRIFGRDGRAIIAEDLGVVPDFVRESCAPPASGLQGAALGTRLEARRAAVPRSRATTPRRSRPAARTTPNRSRSGGTTRRPRSASSAPTSRDSQAGCNSRTSRSAPHSRCPPQCPFRLRLRPPHVPVQDIFGWQDRINMPAVIHDENWAWRLPWPVEDLPGRAAAQDRARSARPRNRVPGHIIPLQEGPPCLLASCKGTGNEGS